MSKSWLSLSKVSKVQFFLTVTGRDFAIFFFRIWFVFFFINRAKQKMEWCQKIVKKIINVTYFSRFTYIELNLISTCILSLNLFNITRWNTSTVVISNNIYLCYHFKTLSILYFDNLGNQSAIRMSHLCFDKLARKAWVWS